MPTFLISGNGGHGIRPHPTWLDGVPLAVVRGTQIAYAHADHLGTPRAITSDTGTIVWRWDGDPFGTTPASEDADGNGVAFAYNPRFPGQYFEAETGLHYNVFRDYDPGIGRYRESDPIGLVGGINTYAYANNNPLIYADEFGLNPSLGAILIGTSITALRACNRITACREAVEQAIKNCKNIECRFERHKRHHSFPSQGGMFCEHYSIRCYKKGVKGSAGLIFDGQWPFPGKCTKIKDNTWLP